jgi:hypothetical protein
MRKPPEHEPRRVRPADVVDAFMRYTDRDDTINQLACKIEALAELCEALAAQLPAKAQLEIIVAKCGRPTATEGYQEVELTE